MGFSKESGYTPRTVEALMETVMEGLNEQFGLSYTYETFVGTNWFKFYYALIQRLQENEIKTSEIFLYLQQFFKTTNESIQRPNTTHPGIYDFFKARGYLVSTKEPLDEDAGKLFVCVDVDDTDPEYETTIRPEICTLLSKCVVAGIVTQGDESEDITLSNGQSFEYKFTLPTKIPILLRLTLTLSENNEHIILSPTDTALILFNKINSKYRLGLDFEPQKYFTVLDAPWASEVLLEYSEDDGENWLSAVASLDFDEVYTFDLEDISIVEA